MKPDLHHALELLGLSKNEASAYLALLKTGQATAYEVAKKSGLKRPTVYVLLDALRMKGVVLKMPNSKKQLYIAKRPDELLQESRERIRHVYSVLPQLIGLMKHNAASLNFLTFEGSAEVAHALYYRIDELKGSELRAFYAKSRGINEKLFQQYRDYNIALYERRVAVRAIIPDHPSLDKFRDWDSNLKWEVRRPSPSLYANEVTIEITSLFVRLIFHKHKQALIIENVELVQSLSQIFDMVWGSLPHKTKRR